jgi:D-glycero-D-manno-heptose 1,7-bisphosphate phosphatase
MTEYSIPQPAAFVDRDGTLIEEVDHLSNIDDLRIYSFTADAIRLLKQNNYHVIVVTNQSGIGRGHFDESEMNAIHSEIQRQLGGLIDGFYFCPHLPDEGCRCRKPNLGMIEAASEDFAIDMSGSWMIGDKKIDVETGHNAGIRSALVSTGYGHKHKLSLKQQPEVMADDLFAAVNEIVKFPRDGS